MPFTLLSRVACPLVVSIVAYAFYRWISRRNSSSANILLCGAYLASRISVWLLFTLFLQSYVTTSDPRLYYVVQLDNFLAGNIPIRDFYYPYAPMMMPAMLPFYVLLGRTLAGISLFAITAEAVALFFFVKCATLPAKGQKRDESRTRQALALYLLNPATLYWTVFQGYHSIVQTSYSMAALYLLLSGYYRVGYGVGLFALAGAKLTAVLDWPALLTVTRLRFTKILWGAIPTILTYGIYQVVTGDIFFPIRYHLGYTGEGNVWYLATLFGRFHDFYSQFPGNLLPIFGFGISFLAGFAIWARSVRSNLNPFSFDVAMGTTTFTLSIFFLFSLYTGSYYVPMIMLPASFIVTHPSQRFRHAVWLVLLISGFCVGGDAVWAALGQPENIVDVLSLPSASQKIFASVWILSILVRIACFAKLAQLGIQIATNTYKPTSRSAAV